MAQWEAVVHEVGAIRKAAWVGVVRDAQANLSRRLWGTLGSPFQVEKARGAVRKWDLYGSFYAEPLQWMLRGPLLDWRGLGIPFGCKYERLGGPLKSGEIHIVLSRQFDWIECADVVRDFLASDFGIGIGDERAGLHAAVRQAFSGCNIKRLVLTLSDPPDSSVE